jgi:hypothetical protein
MGFAQGGLACRSPGQTRFPIGEGERGPELGLWRTLGGLPRASCQPAEFWRGQAADLYGDPLRDGRVIPVVGHWLMEEPPKTVIPAITTFVA